MQYINLIHLYHDFTRSIRNGDLHLYISCFPKLTNYFFALNHPNYARWCVKYYDSLIKLPETHPDVYNDFKEGWFGIKRTKKSFSSTPIDLTLKQTINAHAASQRLGISSITNSISARQRWAESHFLRTTVISSLFDSLGMSNKEDASRHLKSFKIHNDNEAVHKVINMLKDPMNHFAEVEKEHIYNLAIGKAATMETKLPFELLSNWG